MRVQRLMLVGVGGGVLVSAVLFFGGSRVFWEGLRLPDVRSSSDSESPVPPERGIPAIRLSASAMDLGEVPCGEAREGSLVLTNVGTAPLRISEIRTEGPFSLVRTPLLPARIGPGVSVRVSVAVTPERPGAVSDWLRIMSDAPSGVLTVPLRAVARGVLRDEGAREHSVQLRERGRSLRRPTGRGAMGIVAASVKGADVREVTLPLPMSGVQGLPVVRSLPELTSFLQVETIGGLPLLHSSSDETSHEGGRSTSSGQ
jgi:hypothetical protein